MELAFSSVTSINTFYGIVHFIPNSTEAGCSDSVGNTNSELSGVISYKDSRRLKQIKYTFLFIGDKVWNKIILVGRPKVQLQVSFYSLSLST